jgi:hypothetical protein
MDSAPTALARRLVAAKQWRWVAGMQAQGHGYDDLTYTDTTTPQGWEGSTRVLDAERDGYARDADGYRVVAPDAVPDLSDYATAAILLRMAIETGHYADGSGINGALWRIGTGHYDTDLGTVAATALLAAWEK